eukprot:1156700-Pelagomonas_calceolata.AAC.1
MAKKCSTKHHLRKHVTGEVKSWIVKVVDDMIPRASAPIVLYLAHAPFRAVPTMIFGPPWNISSCEPGPDRRVCSPAPMHFLACSCSGNTSPLQECAHLGVCFLLLALAHATPGPDRRVLTWASSVHSTISVGHCWSHPVPVKQLAKHWAMLPLAMPNALKFFVAYNDPQIGMVYEPKLIALNYFRRMVTLVA